MATWGRPITRPPKVRQAPHDRIKLTRSVGLVGFTKTLAREGAKYNIKTNVIVPMAASAMTETIMPPEMLKGLKPEHIAPLVGVLTAKGVSNSVSRWWMTHT